MGLLTVLTQRDGGKTKLVTCEGFATDVVEETVGQQGCSALLLPLVSKGKKHPAKYLHKMKYLSVTSFSNSLFPGG